MHYNRIIGQDLFRRVVIVYVEWNLLSIKIGVISKYICYLESKYGLRISLVHHRDCHFVHVQWLPLSTEKPQTPFREIHSMFMFVPVC